MSAYEQDGRKEYTRDVQNEERRRALVLATYQLIAEKGLEHLRTRDIAARAGVNIATLHYHFVSKEELIHAVVDYLLQAFATPPPSIQPLADTTPWGQIQSMLVSMQCRFEATPELFIVLSELVLRSLRSPSIHTTLKNLDEGWSSYLKQVVSDGIRQGQFRVDLNVEHTARTLIIVMQGATFHHLASGEPVDFEHILKDVARILLPAPMNIANAFY